jgi:hypothetical protein
MKELFEQRGLQIKTLEQDLYLTAKHLREVQDKDQACTNLCAQSRQLNQYGLTKDENIVQAMHKLHSPMTGSYETSNEFNATLTSHNTKLTSLVYTPWFAKLASSYFSSCLVSCSHMYAAC